MILSHNVLVLWYDFPFYDWETGQLILFASLFNFLEKKKSGFEFKVQTKKYKARIDVTMGHI